MLFPPALQGVGEATTAEEELVEPELYVTTRSFRADRSFLGRLPPPARDALSTGGVCHFLCVYKSERGEIFQFDFGPFGGDVHSAMLSDTGSSSSSSSSSTPGHVREKKLDALPANGTYLVGKTSMTLDDVRAFNKKRDTIYNVNKNDCRHYVNDLCELGCGFTNACSKYVKGEVFGRSMFSRAAEERAEERRRRATELAVLVPIMAVTDLENAPLWERLQHGSTAALIIGVGVRAVPPALVAVASARAAAAGGASAKVAASAGMSLGAAAAGLGGAIEAMGAGGILARAAAASKPLVAPVARRLITTAAGVIGGASEDIQRTVRPGYDRAVRAMSSIRGNWGGERGAGTAGDPCVGMGGPAELASRGRGQALMISFIF